MAVDVVFEGDVLTLICGHSQQNGRSYGRKSLFMS